MNTKEAYDQWSNDYDTDENKTRDLEAIALRKVLDEIPFDNCLEVGCGTGKNTEWLLKQTSHVLAVDLSENMLSVAKQKIKSDNVIFKQADINEPWEFADQKYDLITFSLVLEHIENLEPIFKKIGFFTDVDGYVYIGELHPAKQYSGSKARFMKENVEQDLTCFTHHLSDYTGLAQKYGFELAAINEFFDDNDRSTTPGILTLLLKKIV